MNFRDKIELIVKGVPIESKYKLQTTEISFREISESKLSSDDDMNPFWRSSTRFLGNFHGYYAREFSIKPKSSVFRTDSLSNSIWIHGVIELLDGNYLNIKVTYHRTTFAKYGQWVLSGVLGLIFLLINIQSIGNFDFMKLLVMSGVLVFFYLFGILIKIGQINSQIEYFEKQFIEEFKEF